MCSPPPTMARSSTSAPTSTMMDTPGATPPMEAGETVTGALIVRLKQVSDLLGVK